MRKLTIFPELLCLLVQCQSRRPTGIRATCGKHMYHILVRFDDMTYGLILHPANHPEALGGAPRKHSKEYSLHLALDAIVESVECHGFRHTNPVAGTVSMPVVYGVG